MTIYNASRPRKLLANGMYGSVDVRFLSTGAQSRLCWPLGRRVRAWNADDGKELRVRGRRGNDSPIGRWTGEIFRIIGDEG